MYYYKMIILLFKNGKLKIDKLKVKKLKNIIDNFYVLDTGVPEQIESNDLDKVTDPNGLALTPDMNSSYNTRDYFYYSMFSLNNDEKTMKSFIDQVIECQQNKIHKLESQIDTNNKVIELIKELNK